MPGPDPAFAKIIGYAAFSGYSGAGEDDVFTAGNDLYCYCINWI